MRRVVGVVAIAAIALLAWAFVWPAQFGGTASWLVVEGANLEPHFSDGDLIVARELDEYEAGTLVAAQGQDGPVLAVAEESEQILGAPWLSVAGAGTAMQTLTSVVFSRPAVLAIGLTSAIGFVVTRRAPRTAQPRTEQLSAQQDHALAS